MRYRFTNYYFLVLDIETSKYVDHTGKPQSVWLSYGICKLYSRENEVVDRCYFREWSVLYDWLKCIQQFFPKRALPCFVHNLPYEFDFLIKNLSPPIDFLTNSSHSVIACVLEDFEQIQFRCTVKLSGVKLSTLGESLGFPKLESEYRTITPLDSVTKEEIEYCDRDCDIVAKYVVERLLKEFNTFSAIPYTKTGRVRQTYNQFYRDYVKENGKPEWDIAPNEKCYDAECRAFAGGVVISNPMFTGMVLNNVHSYDETSAYPYAQLKEDYPYTIREEPNPTEEMLQEKFWIAKIKFNNIRTRYHWAWLSISKMDDYYAQGSEWFNGKLISTKWAVRTITNVDYETICKTYDFDSIEIEEFYHMDKYGKLPKPYIQTIEKYAKAKSDYKVIVKNTPISDEKWLDVNAEYMQIKGDFNSIYGMCVQKLVQVEYGIDEFYNWKEKNTKYSIEGKHIKRNFLFGVYVTAYARRNLINGIIKNCPNTLVYADTDSIKFIGKNVFINTNEPLEQYKDVPYIYSLGPFDYECTYEKFVTYGAKKYAYTEDGVVYLTVAGLPKFKLEESMQIYYGNKFIPTDEFRSDITHFKIGTLFDKCKLGKKYITENNNFDIDNNTLRMFNVDTTSLECLKYLADHKINTKGGVALYETSYQLDITTVDNEYLLNIRKDFDEWVCNMQQNGIDLTDSISTMLPLK